MAVKKILVRHARPHTCARPHMHMHTHMCTRTQEVAEAEVEAEVEAEATTEVVTVVATVGALYRYVCTRTHTCTYVRTRACACV